MTSLLYQRLKKITRASFWFSFGAIVGFFFFVSFLYITYRQLYKQVVYEGVLVGGIDFGGKTPEEVRSFYSQKNRSLSDTVITLTYQDMTATVSAKEIAFGFDEDLLAKQAYSVGRSDNVISNSSLMLQAYLSNVMLSPAYHYKEDKLERALAVLQKKIETKPVDALFHFENGRVNTFRLSKEGKAVDISALKQTIIATFSSSSQTPLSKKITIPIPVKTIQPKVTAESINGMGIKELIGQGTSLFAHSIENRIFNLSLASSRLNGVLIPPGTTFSTAKTIGDISATTGYKQAYVIANGKTVLGDGGGVCQVSTTLFRAALDAGLPIVERNPHAYRVGYYEQDSSPGIDAAIYYPNVDLKFKNDTGKYILIQTVVDPVKQRLLFSLYGTRDNRETEIAQPIILSESPAPEPLFQDDASLQKGQIKQIDFAAAGAKVSFTRTVKKDGKVMLADTFTSNYRPWQAIFLRGTKE